MGDANPTSPSSQPKRAPLFRIPSAAEVAAANRPTAPAILFRPSSSVASASALPPSQRPSFPVQQNSPPFPVQQNTPPWPAQRPPFPTAPSGHRPPFPPPSASARPSSFAEAFSFARNGDSGGQPIQRPAGAAIQAAGVRIPSGNFPPGLGPTPSTNRPPSGGGANGVNANGLRPTYAAGPVQAPANKNAIVASNRQRGNPLLKHIRNVRWVHGDIVPDYLLGETTCALYLSLRYHLLHPDYIYFRIRELQKNYRLRVVLCHVDVEDVIKPLHEVTKIALLHDCTLICAWSNEECARYLETIKMYENKPADNIQERTDHDYLSRLTAALTTVRHVNKTDTVTLGTTFGSLANLMGASMEELAKCPGIGEKKVKRLYDAFHEPFRRAKPVRVDALLAGGASSAGNLEARAVAAVGTESASAVKAAVRGPVVASIKATSAMPESEGQDSEGGEDALHRGDDDLVDSYDDDDEIEENLETDLAEFLEAPPPRPKRQKLETRKKGSGSGGVNTRRASTLAEVAGRRSDDAEKTGVGTDEEEKVGSAYQNEVEVI